MSRKIKWTEEQFLQPKSASLLKNRDPLNFNDKEIKIFKILLTGQFSPKEIAQKMDWVNPSHDYSPSGLSLYLNRFLKYKWVEKQGVPHSYKNGIKYKLTEKGRKIAKSIVVVSK